MTFLTRRQSTNLEDLFDHVFDLPQRYTNLSLPVDVEANKKRVLVKAELPGLDKKDIKIEYQEGLLEISGEKVLEKEEQSDTRYYQERRSGSFSRSIKVGDVDFEKSTATYENGLLTVDLPRSESTTPKFLSVK